MSTTAIPINLPNAGLITWLPPHQVPPNAMVGGSNMILYTDGSLRPRFGFNSITGGAAPDAAAIYGMLSFTQGAGFANQITVIQTPTHLYKSNVSTTAGIPTFAGFSAITPPTCSANIDNPTRFAVLFEGTTQGNVVYGINTSPCPLMRWSSAVGGAATNPAAGPAAGIDITDLAGRLLVAAPVQTGGTFQFNRRVQWSAINDGTTWPALANIDLDGDDTVIGIKKFSRLVAIVYRRNSIWTATAVPGTDAGAFVFDKVPLGDGVVGPIAPSTIVNADSFHYYVGMDAQVYRFDGIQCQTVSDRIHETFENSLNQSYADRIVSVYHPHIHQIWWFYPSGSSTVNNAAIVYDTRLGIWNTMQSFSGGLTGNQITSAFFDMPLNTESTSGRSVIIYITDGAGNINDFANERGNYLTDNGVAIAWNVSFPVQSHPDPVGSFLVDGMDLYFTPKSAQTLTATVKGMYNPQSASAFNIINANTVDVSNEATWTLGPSPTVVGQSSSISLNRDAIFIQPSLSGTASAGPVLFVGGKIYVSTDRRSGFN